VAAWENWRRRLAGEKIDCHPDEPQCGWYRAKRSGRFVAVQIDLIQDIDADTGELVSDECFIAFIDRDVFYEDVKVAEIWIRCCGTPIAEAEAQRLLTMPKVSDLSREVVT